MPKYEEIKPEITYICQATNDPVNIATERSHRVNPYPTIAE